MGICKALSLAKPPGAQVERLTIVSLPYDPGIDVKVCVGAVATEKSHQLLSKWWMSSYPLKKCWLSLWDIGEAFAHHREADKRVWTWSQALSRCVC